VRKRIPLAFALSLSLSLALFAGCRAPAPFDPGTDCTKIAYCGQCASRGGCSWCGAQDESGKGQCVAVGQQECAAPNAWAKTPDSCPLPPADAGSPGLLASASYTTDAPSPIAKAIGPEKYAAIRAALVRAFPQAPVSNAVVDGVAMVLAHGRPGWAPAGTEAPPLSKRVQEKDHHLYLGVATHHRVKGLPPASAPMQSEFTLALPLVRVALPDALDADNTTISTEIGDVDLSSDHLLGSVDLVAAKYAGAGYLGYRPARVDLITPARAANTRFGAIAVYLGYRNKADRGPSFYLLEAGEATGAARMIYFSPNLQPIQKVTSGYLPTAFVTMRNTYSGGITMRPAPDEDEPAELVVHSSAPGEKDPYITVTVKYERAPTMDLPLPFELTGDAGSRVALIAKTMGMNSAVELEGVLSDLAKTFHWVQYPHYVVPTTTGTTGTTAPPATTATTAPPAATATTVTPAPPH
jgi:hypothetical protein